MQDSSDMTTVTRPSELLTARERECLRLVAAHLQSKQIARRLGIQPTTVDRHCERAMHKLGATDRVEAALQLLADERQTDADYGSPPLELLLSARPGLPAFGGGHDTVGANPRIGSEHADTLVHMGAARERSGFAGQDCAERENGAPPAGGDPQTGAVPARGGDDPRHPLHRLRSDGSGFPAELYRHPLTRLALVVGFAAILAAFAAAVFGAERVALLLQVLRYGGSGP